uniref:HAD hydrolase-like protein n=1 Tax=Phenylobacterium glaciei TaxID=2803784 RepID=A0A974S9E1_9CAUL|nr:HAD hydrolase-like protein [Phenylobacterium glaciei]
MRSDPGAADAARGRRGPGGGSAGLLGRSRRPQDLAFQARPGPAEGGERGVREAGARAPGLTPAFAKTFAERFHAYREEQARFFPGALEAVDELKRRGVKLALVTNGAADVQRAKIDRFDLAPASTTSRSRARPASASPRNRPISTPWPPWA